MLFLAVPAGLERMYTFRQPLSAAKADQYGKWAVVPGIGGVLKLIDLTTGHSPRRFSMEGGSPLGQLVSRDQRLVVSGSQGGPVNVWELATGRKVATIEPGGVGPAYGVIDPTDSSRLFTAGHDGTVAVWSLGAGEPGQPSCSVRRPLQPPSFPSCSASRATAGRCFVGETLDAGTSQVYDVHAGTAGHPGAGHSRRHQADGSVVVTALPEGLQQWDATTGSPVGPLMSGLPQGAALATYSPDGRFVTVGDLTDYHVYVFSARLGVR